MTFRFKRTIKIEPTIRLNLGKGRMENSTGEKGDFNSFENSAYNMHTLNNPLPNSNKASFPIKIRFNDNGTIDFLSEDGTPLSESLIKKIKQQNSSSIEHLIEEHIENTNNDYEACLSVHKQTPSHFNYNDYPHPPPAAPELVKIGFIRNMLGLAEKDKAINEKLIEQHNLKLNDWKVRKEKWPLLIKKADDGDIDAMSIILNDILPRITCPKETFINYDFSTDGKMLTLDIDLPEIEDMPKMFLVRATRGMKINVKKLSEAHIRNDYATLAHGICFRVIGECFSALKYLDAIIVSGYTQRINRATGVNANQYILSVMVTREQWNKIDLRNVSLIAPVDALAQFKLVRDMKHNAEMKKIEPMVLPHNN